MKTRIVSLTLVLALLLGLMVMPAAAAAADGYEYLKDLAMKEGEYDSNSKLYTANQALDEKSSFFVSYSAEDKELLLGVVYQMSNNTERNIDMVTMVAIPENRTGPYDVVLPEVAQ